MAFWNFEIDMSLLETEQLKLFSLVSEEPEFTGCAHTWKAYVGFNDSYNYCTKCDAKEKLS